MQKNTQWKKLGRLGSVAQQLVWRTKARWKSTASAVWLQAGASWCTARLVTQSNPPPPFLPSFYPSVPSFGGHKAEPPRRALRQLMRVTRASGSHRRPNWGETFFLFFLRRVQKVAHRGGRTAMLSDDLKRPFPRSVYSCHGASAAIAFIIDSNYISHWLAHTFIFTSVSLINSISMIIEMEFDECYKTWDSRDKYSPLASSFPLISHFNLEPSPFFSLAIFVPVSSPRALPPCVHLSHFFFFFFHPLLSVGAQLTPKAMGASGTRGACTCE